MIYFTYLKDAGTSHCEKMRVGGPQTFFFDLNCLNSMLYHKNKGKKNASEAKSIIIWIIILFCSFC